MTASWGVGTISTPDGAQPAVLRDGRVWRLAALLPGTEVPRSVLAMLADWDGWTGRIEAALDGAPDAAAWSPAADVEFAPPVPDAPALYVCGANYYDHIEEMREMAPGLPVPDKTADVPFHLALPGTPMVGHRAAVHRPAGTEQLDWEVELVALIGTTADRVTVAQALDHVAGYTVVNDISVRDPAHMHPYFGARWIMAKGQRSMKPMGPVIVPRHLVPDPQALTLTLTVNGELRQNSSTKLMIWSLAEQIAYLSSMVALRPGDLICTGTPAGTASGHDGAWLRDGDELVATVEGVGTLENRVVPAYDTASS